MRSNIRSKARRWLAAATLAFGLAACGGGGSGGMLSAPATAPQGCSAATCGNALVTLTDAAGDFASYTVDVSSLQLKKADGTLVEVLPAKTRVNFTQLVNVTEFVTAASIPEGEYLSATMMLDYANAAIYLYTNAGDTQSAQASKVLDSSGATLWSSTPPVPTTSSVTLTVQLDDKNHLFITPGKLARLAFDFNLAVSNSVDLTNPAAPVVTVKPFILASVEPADSKDIRVRGALVSVNVAGGSYTVNIEPFEDENTDRGQVVVHTTVQTTFEIDGTSYTGSAGLTALNADPPGTMTVAFGTLATTDHAFTAARVRSGSSVESNTLDRLHGVVISRSGDLLVVRGATLRMHAEDDSHFVVQDVMLSIGAGTKFSVDGDPEAAPTKFWPSVGSAITAFGKAGTDPSAIPATFAATAGRLRLEPTVLWGTVSAIGIGHVTLKLQAIEGLPVALFNFAGTGTTPAHDSQPSSYVVTTGPQPLVTLTTAAPLRFIGLVQPFGSAPPDFNARRLFDLTATSAVLAATFATGSAAALTANAAGLVLNTADPLLGPLHVIEVGPQQFDLTTLGADVTILAEPTLIVPFAIRTGSGGGMTPLGMAAGVVSLFGSFADFEAALASKLSGGAKVVGVAAVGQYDPVTHTFTASQLAVDLH